MEDYDILPLTRKGRIERYHFGENLAQKLSLEKTLKGHRLCVNRLAWNHEGTRLLSGSDDKKILMHAYPNYDQLPLSIGTEHASNIFGVQFLPHSGDQILISGAMDTMVQLHRLDAPPETKFCYPSALDTSASSTLGPQATNCVEVSPGTIVFSCHQGRVKDVEVDENSPHLFWSASEDGTIRQYDIRCNFSDQMQPRAPNVLVGVRSQNGASSIDLKGLDINKRAPHLLGVACGDPYVRVFDRRKLSLGTSENTFPEPVLKLSPPHLPLIGYIDEERCHSTYVHFSYRGDRLVAMFHADHAYCFDISSEGTTSCTYVRPDTFQESFSRDKEDVRNGQSTLAPCSSRDSRPQGQRLSQESMRLRDETMVLLSREEYTKAIQHLDRAICYSPTAPTLYVHRARSWTRRKLPGDSMFALRDYDQAIALDPTNPESYLLRCQMIEAMGQLQTAQRLLRSYLKMFPHCNQLTEVVELRQKIKEQLSKRKRQSPSKRSREDDLDEAAEREDAQIEEDSERESGRVLTTNGEAGPSSLSHTDSLESDPDCDEYLYPFYCNEKEALTEKGSPGGVWWKTQGGRRLLTRYIGQLNVQTDIKECIFVGQNDSLVACGSDDGHVFIYNAESGNPVNVLKADEDVCNCVQCHPTDACLATSGIESVVRLWTPCAEPVARDNVCDIIHLNIEAMKRSPRRRYIYNDQMLMRVRMFLDDYELGEVFGGMGRQEHNEEEEEGGAPVNCRMV